ncbi:mitochondrial inner membrane protein OXA1-like isoform X2 [Brassica rapa]|uniref:mitochondrial inner membrane protein OXA1-like isoform X2 n=1 Tax=Brassica campestris TaxID=3711 RepID=UPI000872C50A|nr:mitochondrial inner membrane protein OXA1-like isoform X2 [Brassica rapa]
MASAALRSFSRRKLSPKWFCKTSSSTIPSLVLHHDVKTYNTKPTTFSDSSILLSRSFHRQVFFFEDRKKMTFAQPLGASGVFLCRHISSSSGKPAEESSITLDALGDIVEGLVPEKSVEAAIDGAFENLYFPLNCVQYVINGIHDLTGFNWWIMSIVLTAFLVNGLMSPLSLRIERQVWELKILRMCIQKVRRVMQTCDPKGLAKHKKWEAECTQKFGECYKSYRRLRLIDPFIIISFISGSI